MGIHRCFWYGLYITYRYFCVRIVHLFDKTEFLLDYEQKICYNNKKTDHNDIWMIRR